MGNQKFSEKGHFTKEYSIFIYFATVEVIETTLVTL